MSFARQFGFCSTSGFVWVTLVHLYRHKMCIRGLRDGHDWPSFWVSAALFAASFLCGIIWFGQDPISWEIYTPLSIWMRSLIWMAALLVALFLLCVVVGLPVFVFYMLWEISKFLWEVSVLICADRCECCCVCLTDCFMEMARTFFPCVKSRQGEERILVAPDGVPDGPNALMEIEEEDFHALDEGGQPEDGEPIRPIQQVEGDPDSLAQESKGNGICMEITFTGLEQLRSGNLVEELQKREKLEACMICLEEFQAQSQIHVWMTCWHYYHKQCYENSTKTLKRDKLKCVLYVRSKSYT